MKFLVRPSSLCLTVMTATLLSLCSCASPDRRPVAKLYGVSAEKLPLVEGTWRNTPTSTYDPTLWDSLTSGWGGRVSSDTTPADSAVALKVVDGLTLHATLLTNGVMARSRVFSIQHRGPWLELPTQHVVHPLLWYAIWGWDPREIALGIDADGDLLVNTVGRGTLMILVAPTFIGGGGEPGTVFLYERAESRILDQERKLDTPSKTKNNCSPLSN
jgi:hypothetical protein